MVQSRLYNDAVIAFGKEHQLIVTMGEMAELTSEIARHQIPAREHDEQDLIDEIADVCIMMEQMQVIYGDRLTDSMNKKLNKLEKHIRSSYE